VIKAGTVQAHAGRAPSADVTIKINDDNLLKLLRGELKPMTAMMTGRLKVRGNVMLAQRLIGMVNREKLEAARARIVADQRA
jgi:putative sterol carrier protein